MTNATRALLTAVRDGKPYRGQAATYEAAMAAGWLVWEDTYKRCGPDGGWGRGYVVTDAGLQALAARATVPAGRGVRHAGACGCPRCLREHVQNGCRRVNCPVCG